MPLTVGGSHTRNFPASVYDLALHLVLISD